MTKDDLIIRQATEIYELKDQLADKDKFLIRECDRLGIKIDLPLSPEGMKNKCKTMV